MTYGQIAYQAYCGFSGGKSLISGAPLPGWDELPRAIRDAWEVAGYAVADANAQVREDCR